MPGQARQDTTPYNQLFITNLQLTHYLIFDYPELPYTFFILYEQTGGPFKPGEDYVS